MIRIMIWLWSAAPLGFELSRQALAAEVSLERGHLPGGIGPFDLLVLGALAWWVFRRLVRNRRDSGHFRDALPGKPAEAFRDAHDPRPVPAHRRLQSVEPAEPFSPESWYRHRERWIERFLAMQDAWDRQDLGPVRDWLSPALRGELEKDLDGLRKQGLRNRLEGTVVHGCEPVDAWEEGPFDSRDEYVAVHFTGWVVDSTVDPSTGRVVAGDPSRPVELDEFWTFARSLRTSRLGGTEAPSAAGDWLVTSIERGGHGNELPRLASLY